MAVTARPEPSRFLTRLVLHRNDPQAFLQYGLWLDKQGDPRGELIALQQLLEHRDDDQLREYIANYLWTHRSLVPALDPWRAQLVWKWGFIRAAHLERPSLVEIERLISHPSCVLLEAVSMTQPKPGVRTRMEALPHIALTILEP